LLARIGFGALDLIRGYDYAPLLWKATFQPGRMKVWLAWSIRW
jgi:hypothetical protein